MQALIAEKQLRPAMQPSVELGEGYEPGKDAEVTVELEVLPDVPAPAIDGLKLERLTVPVADEAVDEQLQKFADQQKSWDDAGDKAAEKGDLVTIDFVGKTADGVAFEGGTGTDMAVEIGSGRLIPGFEDQLVGVKAGDEKQISRDLPRRIIRRRSSPGSPRRSTSTIKSVKTAGESAIDERARQEPGAREPRAAARPDPRPDRAGAQRAHAHPHEAQAARPAGRGPRLRGAAVDGRGRVRPDLGAAGA